MLEGECAWAEAQRRAPGASGARGSPSGSAHVHIIGRPRIGPTPKAAGRETKERVTTSLIERLSSPVRPAGWLAGRQKINELAIHARKPLARSSASGGPMTNWCV